MGGAVPILAVKAAGFSALGPAADDKYLPLVHAWLHMFDLQPPLAGHRWRASWIPSLPFGM